MQAMPIGLILFIGTYLSTRRRKSARAQSAEQLPKLAQKKNWTHLAPRVSGDIGVFTGQYESYEIRIDPDEGARITLRFAGKPRVALRTFSFLKRAPRSQETVTTPFRQFDAYFRDRYASPAVIAALLQLGDLDNEVTQLKACPQEIDTLSISEEGIECRLKYERVVCVSAAAVEYLLPLLLRWAKAIDSAAEPATEGEVEGGPGDGDPDGWLPE
jgi:hypothetical protein